MPPPPDTIGLKFFRAFTLAETLITLAIIGVVAALTMPSLITKYQEQQTISQLSKTYSTLSQAYMMMQNEYGPVHEWGLTDTVVGTDSDGKTIIDSSAQLLISQRLQKYLNVAKRCKANEICDNRPLYYLNGQIRSQKDIPITDDISFFLNDGTYISIGWYRNNRTDIFVSLPNTKKLTYGKSSFYFVINSQSLLLPEGHRKEVDSPVIFKTSCNKSSTGRGCTAWVIYNRNMDYLHCNDLDWNGKHKCK